MGKGKRSPYSTAERKVPELILVLGSQPAGDVSHKPGGEMPSPWLGRYSQPYTPGGSSDVACGGHFTGFIFHSL